MKHQESIVQSRGKASREQDRGAEYLNEGRNIRPTAPTTTDTFVVIIVSRNPDSMRFTSASSCSPTRFSPGNGKHALPDARKQPKITPIRSLRGRVPSWTSHSDGTCTPPHASPISGLLRVCLVRIVGARARRDSWLMINLRALLRHLPAKAISVSRGC